MDLNEYSQYYCRYGHKDHAVDHYSLFMGAEVITQIKAHGPDWCWTIWELNELDQDETDFFVEEMTGG